MTLSEYEAITGITVSAANQALVTAQIARTQRILETMLGYTLNAADVNDNEYVEIGKTSTDCPCPDVDMDTLESPDAVVNAYRLYNYNRNDRYFSIDPATAIHAVKLVKDGVTFRTLDDEDYRAHYKQGIVKYLEVCENCCWCTCMFDCYCTQLAVDADWLSTVPADLLDVWAAMVTFYADSKNDIKSETLGSHSYTRGRFVPEEQDYNLAILMKYTGPNGSLHRTVTI